MSSTRALNVVSRHRWKILIIGACTTVSCLYVTSFKPYSDGGNECPFFAPGETTSKTGTADQHGGWNYDEALIKTQHVAFDDGFARRIVQYVTKNTQNKGKHGPYFPVTLGDIGAGVGQFGAWLRDHAVSNVSWSGWDGGSNIESLAGRDVQLVGVKHYIIPHICYIDAARDLTPFLQFMAGAPYDWVVSVEVGEHIPEQQAMVFIDNLVALARVGIILTWTVPGQGGFMHVNEQPNGYVIEAMKERGMVYNHEESMNMRKAVKSLGWLHNTILVFVKDGLKESIEVKQKELERQKKIADEKRRMEEVRNQVAMETKEGELDKREQELKDKEAQLAKMNEEVKRKAHAWLNERTEEKCPFNSENLSEPGSVGPHGGWKYDENLIRTQHVAFDDGFARRIVQYVTSQGKVPVTVGDIGAGVGQLGAWLRDNIVNNVTWRGWDGGSNVEEFAGRDIQLVQVDHYVVPRVCYIDAAVDLSARVKEMAGAPYDFVVSVEVGEHIPEQQAMVFIDNLVALARVGIILTWTVPGQGGFMHVNEQPNGYVIEAMKERGMVYNHEESMNMRKAVKSLGWLHNTILVFVKDGLKESIEVKQKELERQKKIADEKRRMEEVRNQVAMETKEGELDKREQELKDKEAQLAKMNEEVKRKAHAWLNERTEEKCPFNSENLSEPGSVGPHGGWKYDENLIRTQHVAFDDGFARRIVQYVTSQGKVPVTVGDIGAGVGQLGAWLRDNIVNNVTWRGWDGGSNVEEFAGRDIQLVQVDHYVVPHVCYIDAAVDLSARVEEMAGAPYDFVVSVEVGEHIPEQQAIVFMDNLVALARLGVILTWAVPGQGGFMHVNEQDNEYVIEAMKERGLSYNHDESMAMRKAVKYLPWLTNTILVFEK